MVERSQARTIKAATLRRVITQADLLRLDAQDKWGIEVEDGYVIRVARDMTFYHLLIIRNLYDILSQFLKAHGLGTVWPDGGRYILHGHDKDIRRAYTPDLSFLRAGRIPPDFNWEGDFFGAPDLAVEVISRGQGTGRMTTKIGHYLRAGGTEAWLIYPKSKTLYQYRDDEEAPNVYKESGLIDTSLLFSGLALDLAALFVTE
jgi:Uma2 family endonuclease